MSLRQPLPALCVCLLLGPPGAVQAEPNPEQHYEVQATASKQVGVGERGQVTVAIKTKGGAYVSDEAPLKLELRGKQVKLAKGAAEPAPTVKFGYADAIVQPSSGKKPDPSFQAAVVGETKGSGAVDADLTFFICTENLCLRQKKALSLPVEVQ
jgi:hypothetical protein